MCETACIGAYTNQKYDLFLVVSNRATTFNIVYTFHNPNPFISLHNVHCTCALEPQLVVAQV